MGTKLARTALTVMSSGHDLPRADTESREAEDAITAASTTAFRNPRVSESVRARQDHDLVRSILRNPIKGIDQLRMIVRRENERPAVAVEFDSQHTIGISRQLRLR
jgi:hypothetical protein